MRTPLPPHPYRDALLLPSPPSSPATYNATTAPKRRQRHGTIPHDTVTPTPPVLANLALDTSIPSATPPVTDFCFHGTAINPDNGKIAGYKELMTCSTAPLWATANGLEIGRLFQGLGPNSTMPTGTNCCFLINKHDMP